MAVNGATGEVMDTMNVEETLAELAREDALRDIAADNRGDLAPAYFGSALIQGDDFEEPIIENILIPYATNYAEAVGEAYLQLRDKYQVGEGYRIRLLEMEEDMVWVEKCLLEDDDPDKYGMGAILPIDQ